jgi:hypothetical protein
MIVSPSHSDTKQQNGLIMYILLQLKTSPKIPVQRLHLEPSSSIPRNKAKSLSDYSISH